MLADLAFLRLIWVGEWGLDCWGMGIFVGDGIMGGRVVDIEFQLHSILSLV